MSALFEFEDVLVEGADGTRILEIDHVAIPEDGITVIVGPSGAGKSTLLRLCNRLGNPTRGTIRFRGNDLDDLDVLELRRTVGVVFQQPVLFGGTGLDNLAVADSEIDEQRGRSLFEEVGLDTGFLSQRVDDLSGGEAQRLCLARTLATGPSVLLMDEPTSSLDPAATGVLEGLARRLADRGVPVLWVTHDVDQVHRLADRVMVIVDHRLQDDQKLVQDYLGGGLNGRR